MANEKFIVGIVRLNGKQAPLIEIVLDTASGRVDGEVVLLREVANETNRFYADKLRKNNVGSSST